MKVEEKEFVDDQLRIFSPESVKIWDDNLNENYTINFVLDKPEWHRLYEKLVHEFAQEGDDLYIYPFERLHMTLLGRIDKRTDPRKIIEVVKKEMAGKKFGFKIGYLANNNKGVSIISEPEFDLGELRNNLRMGLGVSGDDYTKYSNIYEKLAWLNFIRFKKVPGERFFEKLWNMRNYQFGEFKAEDICLYLNSSATMDPQKSTLIEKIGFLI